MMEHRTVQPIHLDFDDLPPLALAEYQFSVLVPLGVPSARLELCPRAWNLSD